MRELPLWRLIATIQVHLATYPFHPPPLMLPSVFQSCKGMETHSVLSQEENTITKANWPPESTLLHSPSAPSRHSPLMLPYGHRVIIFSVMKKILLWRQSEHLWVYLANTPSHYSHLMLPYLFYLYLRAEKVTIFSVAVIASWRQTVTTHVHLANTPSAPVMGPWCFLTQF